MYRVIILFFLLIVSATRNTVSSDTLESEVYNTAVPAPLPENERYGSVTVTAVPEESIIYLDGKRVGAGSTTLTNYPGGYHQLYVYNQENRYEELIFIPPNEKTVLKVDLDHIVNLLAIPSFSFFINKGLLSYGPSFDIGMKFKKQYFGINYTWAIINSGGLFDVGDYVSEKSDYAGIQGGSSINWNYTLLNLENFLTISPGVTSGFWIFKGREYGGEVLDTISGQTEIRYDFFEDLLFIGASLNIRISHEIIFLNIEYSALFGTGFCQQIKAGIGIGYSQ